MTGGDTHHYTTEDLWCLIKNQYLKTISGCFRSFCDYDFPKKEGSNRRIYIELIHTSFYDPVNFNSWICLATSDMEISYAHFAALARPQKFGQGMHLIHDDGPTLNP